MELLTNGVGLSVVVFFPLISAFIIKLIQTKTQQYINFLTGVIVISAFC